MNICNKVMSVLYHFQALYVCISISLWTVVISLPVKFYTTVSMTGGRNKLFHSTNMLLYNEHSFVLDKPFQSSLMVIEPILKWSN